MLKRAAGLVLVCALAACTSLLGDFTVTPDAGDAGDLDAAPDASVDAGADSPPSDAPLDADAGPGPCGAALTPCCAAAPSCAGPGLVCIVGTCQAGTAADLGKYCAINADCSMGICAPLGDGGLPGVCSELCGTQACPPAPNWTCAKSGAFGGAAICTCDGTLKIHETCDGLDNDCNGLTDDGANADCTGSLGPAAICTAAKCVCAGVMCSGTCIDPQTDDANCGACGHTCHGGKCIGGACQPVIVQDVSPLALAGIAIDPTAVYFAVPTGDANGSIQACGNGDGPCPGGVAVVRKALAEPYGVAAFGGTVLAGTQLGGNGTLVAPSLVFTCAPPACATSTVESSAAPGTAQYTDVATDGTFVVWLDQGVTGGRILAATVGGASAIALVPPAAGVSIAAFALANGRVYWSQTTAAGGSVVSCPVSATTACTAPTTTAEMTGLQRPAHIATDGAQVLFVADRGTLNLSDGAIYACTFPCASNTVVLAGQQANASDVVFDATHVYWTLDVSLGAIRGCTRAACTPKDLTAQASPSHLVQDQLSTLYWTVGSLLMRIAK